MHIKESGSVLGPPMPSPQSSNELFGLVTAAGSSLMYTGVRPDDTAGFILKNSVQELGWKAASEVLFWRRSSSKISPQSQGKPSAQVSQQ